MIKLKNVDVDKQWLERLYCEAWQQYCHEDDIGVSRAGMFIAVETGLVALLGFASGPVIDACQPWGLCMAGLLWFVVGCIGLYVGWVWRCANSAGRCYLNLRWCSAYAIERLAGVSEISLAIKEDAYKDASKRNKHKILSMGKPPRKFKVFSNIDELQEVELNLLPRWRGWASLDKLTYVYQVAFGFLAVGGIVMLVAFLRGSQ